MTPEFPQPFAQNFDWLLKRLKLHGMQPKTIDLYSYGVRRAAEYFEFQIGALTRDHLKLLLQHILPKGFRRARNFGFLHHNSKLVKRVQWIKKVFVPPPQPRPTVACPCCGNPLRILRTRVRMSILRRSDVLDREMPM